MKHGNIYAFRGSHVSGREKVELIAGVFLLSAPGWFASLTNAIFQRMKCSTLKRVNLTRAVSGFNGTKTAPLTLIEGADTRQLRAPFNLEIAERICQSQMDCE